MSLRAPQRKSLEILDTIGEMLALRKGDDVPEALKKVQGVFPGPPEFADFEREFPSFCFALATGVGKTRLMGAFITYLYLKRGFRHFFVLAPNLTIYDKLQSDFRPGTPKYVFQGIGDLATNPPEIITGDTWESGRGVRKGQLNAFASDEIHINIFNISKINAEVKGGKAPRIKRLHEYIGQSYFDYLSGLDDLVLLMDESHRYRASAGAKAINELRPVLGLELTATPQVETAAKSERFKNIIFAYPLSDAMTDGFVKEPAVLTRKDFNPKEYGEAQLERLKLEDGIAIHEHTKVKLSVYAKENDKPLVKPFVLVVARDVAHAEELAKLIEDPGFFDGRYKGRVITVHSGQSGVEKDETIDQLIKVEKADSPTEIVIHVNMLKEGWDVTNLYTIIPLRKADSKTLVEQSIGRGLRLPYGRRTGVEEVDRLTIVAHDKFQEIVDYAKKPDSMIRGGIKVIYAGGEKIHIVEARPVLDDALFAPSDPGVNPAQAPLFVQPQDVQIARITKAVMEREFSRLPSVKDVLKPQNMARLEERVRAELGGGQQLIEGVAPAADIQAVVKKTAEACADKTIDIPRVNVVPIGESNIRHEAFKVDFSSFRQPPVEEALLVRHLHDDKTHIIAGVVLPQFEDTLEKHIVRRLWDYDDVCYADDAEVLYDLAGQAVAHLCAYLKNEDEVRNVVIYHESLLAQLIHSQMQAHEKDVPTSFQVHVKHGWMFPPTAPMEAVVGEEEADYRLPPPQKSRIPKLVFTGFRKCIYTRQRFHSDPERRFTVLLERNDSGVVRWMKPPRNFFRINYFGEHDYEPDFVVELSDRKLVCEVKDDDGVEDKVVQAKARGAAAWCEYANRHAAQYGGKLWSYLLVPESDITDNATLTGLAGKHTFRLEDDFLKKIQAYGIDPDSPGLKRP